VSKRLLDTIADLGYGRNISVGVLVAIVFAGSASANEVDTGDSGTAEIVVADEVRTAFYEHAPRSLAAAMFRAVESWCSKAGRTPDEHEAKAETVSWLCGGQKLSYFRSVYVTGTVGSHGLVCENNGTSTLKYFGTDLVDEVVGDGSCVLAELDGTTYRLNFKRTSGPVR
jgi:hypothetical protein